MEGAEEGRKQDPCFGVRGLGAQLWGRVRVLGGGAAPVFKGTDLPSCQSPARRVGRSYLGKVQVSSARVRVQGSWLPE